jgi:glucose/arabinose dehydrogenase
MKHAAMAVSLVLAAAGPAWSLSPVQVGSGFDQPLFVTGPAGDSRLFVVEKTGRIQLLQNGVSSTYLNLSGIVDTAGEGGLLGLAFDPQFASNARFYVYYIDKNSHDTVVASYTAPSASASTADPASGRTILTVDQPAGLTNHKGGWIGFRPGDGNNLYIATGDGGGGNDPNNVAQNLSSNLGKMLRVTPLADGGYTIPAGNPFAGATAGNDEIWSYGLRNPFRNSFDRMTGDFWIGDVGQNTREEINFESAATPGGRNYGWRAREGSIDNPGVGDPAPPNAVDPFFDYPHGSMGGTVIGGYVYRGTGEAGLDGTYFFGDFNSGKIFSLRNEGGTVAGFTDRTAELGTPFGGFTLGSMGEDGLGNLYLVGLDGQILRFATAVPEPGSWALFAAGLAGLALWRRRFNAAAGR